MFWEITFVDGRSWKVLESQLKDTMYVGIAVEIFCNGPQRLVTCADGS